MSEPKLPDPDGLHYVAIKYRDSSDVPLSSVLAAWDELEKYVREYGLACYRQAWREASMACAEACDAKYAKDYDRSHRKHAGKALADECRRIGEHS